MGGRARLIRSVNAERWNCFSGSVALNGNGDLLAVGAPAEDGRAAGIYGDGRSGFGAVRETGAVYIFRRVADAWLPQGHIKAGFPQRYSHFGEVALSGDGNTLVVGAPGTATLLFILSGGCQAGTKSRPPRSAIVPVLRRLGDGHAVLRRD